MIDVPSLDVLADRAGTDEGVGLDLDSGALLDLGDRRDVGEHGPSGAGGLELQLAVLDVERQLGDVAEGPRPGSREADVGG